jgi:enamine deaminase RidA (YjgF/YER057c/UK114 family)
MPSMQLLTPPDLPAPAGYSHVAIVSSESRLVWTSGQVPLAADGSVVGAGDWEMQTCAAMENVGRALTAAGATWADVFNLTIYLTDTSELQTVRAVRDRFIDREHPPTSSLVHVTGLFRPDILIEIEAVAAVPAER